VGFIRRFFLGDRPEPVEPIDTLVVGDAPEPARGEPFRVRLRSGTEIELAVNTDGIERSAVDELLGPGENDFVDRMVRVVLLRDPDSDRDDAVRVRTRKGRNVGHVVVAQSYFACELIAQAGEAVGAIDPGFVDRAPHLDVAMRVEGYRDPEGSERTVDAATVCVSLPVRVQSFGEPG
jgi:hypothetical protein